MYQLKACGVALADGEGGKEKEQAVKRKQERKMEKEAKRAKDSQSESAASNLQQSHIAKHCIGGRRFVQTTTRKEAETETSASACRC